MLAYGLSLSPVVSKNKTNKETEETDYETLRREIFEETSHLDKIKYKFKKNGFEIKKEVSTIMHLLTQIVFYFLMNILIITSLGMGKPDDC